MSNNTIPGFLVDEIKMQPAGILEVLRDEFGDWDIQDQLENHFRLDEIEREYRHEKFNSAKFSSIIGYRWKAFEIIIFFTKTGKGFQIHWSVSGITVYRRFRKVLKIAKNEDEIWMIRKLLWYYVDNERLKKSDAFFKLKLEFTGIILAGLTILLGLFYTDFARISSLGAISIAIIWGVYRYGISINSIDLRFLSVANFYWLLLQGFPISLLTIYVVLSDLYSIGIVIALPLFMTSARLTQWMFENTIYRSIIRKWSEIRHDVTDTTCKTIPNIPTKETKLARVAILQFSKGYTISLMIIISCYIYSIIWVTIGFSWPLYFVVTIILIFLMMVYWKLGIYRGLSDAKEEIKNSGPYLIKIRDVQVVISAEDSQSPK